MRNIIYLFILSFYFSPLGILMAQANLNTNCAADFSTLAKPIERDFSRLSVDEKEALIKLEETKIADIFKENFVTHEGDFPKMHPKVTGDEISDFKEKFDSIFKLTAKADPNINKMHSDFSLWLSNKKHSRGAYPELSRGLIQSYRDSNKNLKQFFWDQIVQYQMEKVPREKWASWAKSLSKRSIREHYSAFRIGALGYWKTISSSFIGSLAAIQLGPTIIGVTSNTFIEPIKKYIGIDQASLKNQGEQFGEWLKSLPDEFEGQTQEDKDALIEIRSIYNEIANIDFSSVKKENYIQILDKKEKLMADKFQNSRLITFLNKQTPDRVAKQIEILRMYLPALMLAVQNFNSQNQALKETNEQIAKASEDYNRDLGTATNVGGIINESDDFVVKMSNLKNEQEVIKNSIISSEKDIARYLALWKVYRLTLPVDKSGDKQNAEAFDQIYSQIFYGYLGNSKNIQYYAQELKALLEEQYNLLAGLPKFKEIKKLKNSIDKSEKL